MKHKIGEKIATSFLPLTHGPRRDYSQSITEAILVMEGPPEINPPSSRVSGQELLLILILGSRWRRKSDVDCAKESSPRVFGTGCKYRIKGGVIGGATWPCDQGVRPAPGCAVWPPR